MLFVLRGPYTSMELSLVHSMRKARSEVVLSLSQ